MSGLAVAVYATIFGIGFCAGGLATTMLWKRSLDHLARLIDQL